MATAMAGLVETAQTAAGVEALMAAGAAAAAEVGAGVEVAGADHSLTIDDAMPGMSIRAQPSSVATTMKTTRIFATVVIAATITASSVSISITFTSSPT